jgi:hypothetical protein
MVELHTDDELLALMDHPGGDPKFWTISLRLARAVERSTVERLSEKLWKRILPGLQEHPDTKRLDWLLAHPGTEYQSGSVITYCPTSRAEIDGAMAKEQGK